MWREEAQASQIVVDTAKVSADLSREETLTLHQRAWPRVEMMKRAHAENASIVWGV